MNAILRFPALVLIQLYRWCISPFLPVACRFHPTCSDYAKQALAEHGLWRGVVLTLIRIVRCNPWGGSGIDNVPPAACSHTLTPPSGNERP